MRNEDDIECYAFYAEEVDDEDYMKVMMTPTWVVFRARDCSFS